MKHGGDRHVHITRLESFEEQCPPQAATAVPKVEYQLTMTIIDPFRIAGGPRGIKSCGLGIFVKLREIERIRRLCNQLLHIAAIAKEVAGRSRTPPPDVSPARRPRLAKSGTKSSWTRTTSQPLVHCEEYLLGRKPNVKPNEDCAHHGELL